MGRAGASLQSSGWCLLTSRSTIGATPRHVRMLTPYFETTTGRAGIVSAFFFRKPVGRPIEVPPPAAPRDDRQRELRLRRRPPVPRLRPHQQVRRRCPSPSPPPLRTSHRRLSRLMPQTICQVSPVRCRQPPFLVSCFSLFHILFSPFRFCLHWGAAISLEAKS